MLENVIGEIRKTLRISNNLNQYPYGCWNVWDTTFASPIDLLIVIVRSAM